ncbi:GNAT family N-acetyltransferase [Limibaculum sp. M0105]|uniref:GNAT family N-acetyltransferase n=1 Tax=Thermohalobaculum xanthum TaxID=2753746 RepID=A0A8J7M4Y0_9RHOB|nr:GNAT family N-acetyltransferase [Thermohalobaculum xanthum]MBK0397762.1 GNAT family N-acetyltransferase [Thermohalobaculum xanthum]
MPQSPEFVDLREAAEPVLGAVLAQNARVEHHTSPLDPARLRALVDASRLALATPDGAAFVIAFDEAGAYDSPNFLWFRERLNRFLYIDRIVVASELRGRGMARALYDRAFEAAAAAGLGQVVCEVNREPPNPGSDAFHAALGFAEIGRGAPSPGKVVRYLSRPVTGEGPT